MLRNIRKLYRYLCSVALAGAFLCMLVTTGCAARVRYYDPVYHDYHYWNQDEAGYYHQWETETHRQHVDFKNRSQDEKNEYWKWRHSHQNDH
jgi:hypothetical protein